MLLDWTLIVVFLGLGSVAGFLAGLLGIGGGGLMVPVLTTIFIWKGIDSEHFMHLALGTSMAVIVTTSISSMVAHHRRQAVIWPIVKSIAPAVVIGAYLGTYLVSVASSSLLVICFALFMFILSVHMFNSTDTKTKKNKKSLSTGVLSMSGLVIGVISALVSIGGGSMTVPLLSRFGVPIQKAIGTSAAVGFPIAVAATVGYVFNGWSQPSVELSYGYVYWPAAVLITLSSVFFAPIGARFAHNLPVYVLRRVFSLLLFILAVFLVKSVFK